jgi:hypothetical protein
VTWTLAYGILGVVAAMETHARLWGRPEGIGRPGWARRRGPARCAGPAAAAAGGVRHGPRAGAGPCLPRRRTPPDAAPPEPPAAPDNDSAAIVKASMGIASARGEAIRSGRPSRHGLTRSPPGLPAGPGHPRAAPATASARPCARTTTTTVKGRDRWSRRHP